MLRIFDYSRAAKGKGRGAQPAQDIFNDLMGAVALKD